MESWIKMQDLLLTVLNHYMMVQHIILWHGTTRNHTLHVHLQSTVHQSTKYLLNMNCVVIVVYLSGCCFFIYQPLIKEACQNYVLVGDTALIVKLHHV